MRIALTGATGILGEALMLRAVDARHEIVSVSRDQLLGSRQALQNIIAGVDVVIHAAANTNVEACELDPATCYRDNLLLSERLAEACLQARRKLVFISSTGVYGPRQDQPYAEYDAAEPPTHHHRAKKMAESAVMSFSRMNLVIRTGWLFGGSPRKPKNFVARRLEEATSALQASQTELFANPLQRGNPTFTEDVADRLFEAIGHEESGIFNLVNTGDASRLEYVQAILDAAGLPIRAVPPSVDTGFQRVARVSHNDCALNWRFGALGYAPMPDWKSSLNRYIATLRAQK